MTQPNSLVIPGYRIGRKLGQGGMATVYLAIQESFDREVALKIMSPFLNSDPSFTTRFVREARIVSQIHHASIVPVMDVGEHQTHHYLSMEYLPGGDLKHRIAESKHGLSLAVNTCLAISAALDVAHRKGFVHRDIKPENILFREDGTPVLTDFGIARAIDSGASLTMAGMMVGTPNYMSPEQVKGQELDGRSDLYSLGIVFYETLTGAVPFRADSTMSLALKHLSDPLPPLPPEFALYQPFIDRLTAKEREDRFASGAEVQRALRLINEMATRRPVHQQQAPMPAMSPTLSMPIVHSQPKPEEVYEQTLVTTRAPTGTAAAAPPLEMAPQAPPKAPPQPKVKPIRAPAPPSKLMLALEAAGPALRGSIAHGARWTAATTARGWTQVSSFAIRARRSVTSPPRKPQRSAPDPLVTSPLVGGPLPVGPSRSGSIPLSNITARPAKPTLAGWLRTFTANPRRSRHAAWASFALVVVALGFGSYWVSRPDAPQPQPAAIVQAQPIPEPELPATPALTVPEGLPLEPSEEVLAILERISEERTALSKVQVLVERARVREERRVAAEKAENERQVKLAKEEQDRQKRIRDDQSISTLLVTIQNDYYDGRIYQPAGNSAVDHYAEILKLRGNQADALAGVRRITDVVAAEIDRYLKVGRTTEGSGLIARLRAFQPQHPQLAILDARLQEIQATPIELARRERDKLLRNERDVKEANKLLDKKTFSFRDMNRAGGDYEELAKDSPDTPGLETLRERIVVMIPGAAKQQMEDNNTKDAKKMLEMARKRNLASEDLKKWEEVINQTSR